MEFPLSIFVYSLLIHLGALFFKFEHVCDFKDFPEAEIPKTSADVARLSNVGTGPRMKVGFIACTAKYLSATSLSVLDLGWASFAASAVIENPGC